MRFFFVETTDHSRKHAASVNELLADIRRTIDAVALIPKHGLLLLGSWTANEANKERQISRGRGFHERVLRFLRSLLFDPPPSGCVIEDA